ncbi:GTPase HflX [Desertifilum tharense]|uniref:GTPase HflX n=1 Tax=Desertifilum tharense IPPAS B-1220 TaxID=1781255 RepID=A0A1E5QEH1_9CYAN|nr:GTPase HflX [Desertifilum tharense]MDA0212605.1 GTPase HflX [Cyanobacteria bacterium FC1]OEJ73060.1 GTPase HflX [Desertifilum tharense IPPAS B-1220]
MLETQEGRKIETIYGNLQGLKSSQLKQLQRLYHQRLPGDRITTPEFAQRMAAISTEINQPVCSYINRRGQVIRVGVGSPRQTQIPPLELPRYGAERLCGIRCIATQLKISPPGEADLTAMAIQRLDALVLLTLSGSGFERRGGGATGYVKDTYLAHLIPHPEVNWTISPPHSLDVLTNQDFLDLVEGLEEEFRARYVAQQVDLDHDRVLVVGLKTDKISPQRFEDGLQEVSRLVETAGGDVLKVMRQKRSQPHPQTVVGAGKVQEIALAVQTIGANLVVFDRDLSPAQVRNIEVQTGVRVVDRTEVILDIFAQRAQSRAGKLQVELAQLEYSLPRLTGRGRAMSRLGGGIGTRGPGETKLETERRAIGQRIARLQQEVNQLQAHRSRLRQQRQHHEVPTVAVVGYTNAGKSTLLNALTNAEVYTADQLFATLDPTTRRLVVPHAVSGEPLALLLTDTVGFIHELPPPLIDAFRATLEEVTEADALLHLVDLSHPAWQSHIRSVMALLSQMPTTPGPALLAFNKIDCVDGDTLALAQEEYPQAVFVSAGERLGLETLRSKLGQLVKYAIA